jgi:hypothetical protein
LGDGAVAIRLSGTRRAVDWAVSAFKGLNRRPTFVPRFSLDGRVTNVDAVYTEVLQIGAELETTVRDFRLVGEGFSRRGAMDISGRRLNYGHISAAAEYQRFGAFGGGYDVIPRLQVVADTREDRADLPFASSVRAGVRFSRPQIRAAHLEVAYSYDWSLRGHGFIGSAEKRLGESPLVVIGGRITAFSAGARPGVLDLWTRDLELLTYARIEISR